MVQATVMCYAIKSYNNKIKYLSYWQSQDIIRSWQFESVPTPLSALSQTRQSEVVRCGIMRNDNFLSQFKVLIDIRLQYFSQFRWLLSKINYHVRNSNLLLFVNALKRTRIAATPAACGRNSLFAAAAPTTKSKARGYTMISMLNGLSVYTIAIWKSNW